MEDKSRVRIHGCLAFVIAALTVIFAIKLGAFSAVCVTICLSAFASSQVGVALVAVAAATILGLGSVAFFVMGVALIFSIRHEPQYIDTTDEIDRPTRIVMSVLGSCAGSLAGLILGLIITLTGGGWPLALLGFGICVLIAALIGYAFPNVVAELFSSIFQLFDAMS